MKLAVTSIAAVAAALVAASPAAAVNLSIPIIINPLNNTGDIGGTHGGTILEPNGTAFTDTFTFTSTLTGVAAAAAISITVSTVPNYLNLTSATLNGMSTTFTSSTSNGMRVYIASLMAPTVSGLLANSLTISGMVVGSGGQYNGNVSIAAAAAVPEAASWAMMVLGFGVVGGALRASRRKVVFA